MGLLHFLVLVLTAVIACGPVSYGSTNLSQQSEHPNLVYILADDLGYGDPTSYNRDSMVSTHNIDLLADNGMLFTDAHASAAVCSPTRYALLTGQYGYRTGVVSAVSGYADGVIDPSIVTVAEMLQEAGYTTSMSGKWHLGLGLTSIRGHADWSQGVKDGPTAHGFDTMFGLPASIDMPPYKFLKNDQFLHHSSEWLNGPVAGIAGGSGWADSDWAFHLVNRRVTVNAVEFIENRQGKDDPFFLYVPLPAPHKPASPHPDFHFTQENRYLDYVAEVDDTVGRIVKALEDISAIDNTLIIFASDNGARADRANRHGHIGTGFRAGVVGATSVPLPTRGNVGMGFRSGVMLRGQKGDIYEGGHRVPFIVRWGDGTDEGSVIGRGLINNELIDTSDFYATAAAIAGMPLAVNQAGDSINMLPTLLGDGTDLNLRRSMITTSQAGAVLIRHDDEDGNQWKLIYSDGSGGFLNVQRTPVGTTLDPLDGITDYRNLQLFNLANDPGESLNLLLNGGTRLNRTVADHLHALMVRYLNTGRSRPVLGDVDNNGFVDNLDMTPFILALTASNEYTFWHALPGSAFHSADMNHDGSIDNVDITPFTLTLAGVTNSNNAFAAPEPSTALVLLMCWLASVGRRSGSARL